MRKQLINKLFPILLLLFYLTSCDNSQINQKQLRWKTKVPGGVYSTPALYYKILIIGDTAGNLTAILIENKKKLASINLGSAILSSPLVNNNLIITATKGGEVYGLYLIKNEKKEAEFKIGWKLKTNGAFYADPVSDKKAVYLGNHNRNFFSINKQNGNIIFKQRTKGNIYGKALIFKNMILFATKAGEVYNLNNKDGKIIWQKRIAINKKENFYAQFQAGPLIYQDKIILADIYGNIYFLNLTDGAILKKRKIKGGIKREGMVYLNTAYFPTDKGRLVAYNIKEDKIVWEYKTFAPIYSHPIIAENTMYFGTDGYKLIALNFKTGTPYWSFKTKGIIWSSIVKQSNAIFFADSQGFVYAINSNKL